MLQQLSAVLALVYAVYGLYHAIPASAAPTPGGAITLGVRVLKPLFAKLPRSPDGRQHETVVLTVWLRRVGSREGPYDMPHQAQDAIRLTVWADTPTNLQRRAFGHLMLPAEHYQWRPRLRLEVSEPGPVLEAAVEPGKAQYDAVWGSSPRPYSYRVELPAGAGNCFKLIEASYPKHKAPVCLAPAREDPTCDWLAPPGAFTAAAPALYTVVGPARHGKSTREWGRHLSHVAGRLINYVSYHVAMGVSGLLQYTDELMREHLMREPEILDLVRRGHLRFVHWDMPERTHDDNDGGGRPLGYNYDQALVASHALLGTSACGANLMLLVTDLDEFLYFPRPGRTWPEPWGRCMGPTGGQLATTKAATAHGLSSPPPVTVLKVQRFDLTTSRFHPDEESRLWATPIALPPLPSSSLLVKSVSNGSAAAASGGGGGLRPHPLSLYDRLFRKGMSKVYVKQAQLPAADVVLFFVHEGAPVHGRAQLVHHRCAILLHVPNFFRGRRGSRPEETRQFRHWIFMRPGDNTALAEVG